MSKRRRKPLKKTQKESIEPIKDLSPPPASNVKLIIGLIIVVCIIVAVVHWPALSAKALLFDDNQYVTENLLVQHPSRNSAKRFLTEVLEPSTVGGYYQPLAMISLMLDYAIAGNKDNLMPFHRTSLIFHLANTALIIILLYLLFGQAWIAAGVGLLFGVHPMTVEPIPWIGERKTLLAAFFAFGCLIMYVKYTRNNNWKSFLGCFLLYVLALMSKPTSTPLPAVMLLMDHWPLKKLNKKAFIEKIPFFIIGGIFAIITVISQGRTASITVPSDYGPSRIPLTLCHNILFYLYKIIYPINLTAHYAFPNPFNSSQPMVLAGIIGTCILIPLLMISLRWTRALLTGWLIFFVAIFPTMGVIGFTNVIASDKFAYLPSIGILMILSSFIYWFCSTYKSQSHRIIVALVILVLATTESCATRRYLSHWTDKTSLFKYMLKLTPDSPSVLSSLAAAFDLQGQTDEAINYYYKSLKIQPNSLAYNNLGYILEHEGKLDEAVNYYRKALAIKPNYGTAHGNLANVLLKQNKLDEAVSHYRQSLKHRPNDTEALLKIGLILKQKGKIDEAINFYNQALKLNPDYVEAHNNMGNALRAKGQLDEAVKHFQYALQNRSNDVYILYNLASTLHSQGKLNEATKYYRQLLKIKPNDFEAHCNIGLIYQTQGRLEEAIKEYRLALKINPNYARAKQLLQAALATQGK